jgi:hypothetical protein
MVDMATEIRTSDSTAPCLAPLDEARSVVDSVRVVVDDEALLFSTGEAWTAD